MGKAGKKKVLTLEPKTQSSSKSKKRGTDKSKKPAASKETEAGDKSCAQLIGMDEEQVKDLQVKTQAVEKQAKEDIDLSDNEEGSTSLPSSSEKVKVMRKKSKKREKQFISLADSESEGTRKRTRKPNNRFLANRGIVVLKNIPHGFYEKQMMSYFSQFGTVTNLKLNRSRHTGASKGTAFIEFQYEDVAKIVAETMNNYLMFNRIMKCKLLPKETNGFRLFLNKIDPHNVPGIIAKKRERALMNDDTPKPEHLVRKKEARKKKYLDDINEKLASHGIDYRVEIS